MTSIQRRADEEAVGYEIVTVRENSSGEHDLAISLDSDKPPIRDVGDYGAGTDLEVPAHDEIRDRVDVEEHDVGQELAKVWYDYDAWAYEIEYLVPVTVLDRVRERVSSAVRRVRP